MKIIFRIHAIERMFERGIGIKEIRAALETGENIENYAEATEYPARLVLAQRGRRSLHVVAADNLSDDEIIVITGYRPDPARWTEDFRRRRDEVPDV
jgi:hypothetical protein